MTDGFITLSNTELDQVSGGSACPFVHPNDPHAPHGGWRGIQPPISEISLFNDPGLYRKGTTTVKSF